MTDAAAQNEQLVTAYRLCFGNPAGQMVLADLMKMSRFRVPLTTPSASANELFLAEGKRQMFLRIVSMMMLTEEQIMDLFAGRRLNLTGANE